MCSAQISKNNKNLYEKGIKMISQEITVFEEEVTFEELEEMEDVVNGSTSGIAICCSGQGVVSIPGL